MKLVLAFSNRAAGSVEDNLAAGESAQKLLSTWAPNSSVTMHQWVQRCDGDGGFAVLETDDLAALYKDLVLWSAWLTFEVHPVLDITDAQPLLSDALAIARSVV